MSRESARLVVVQLCVKQLWKARANGGWAALEHALIEVLDPKKSGIDRRVRTRRNNVILLSDYLERRRLADRRAKKPP